MRLALILLALPLSAADGPPPKPKPVITLEQQLAWTKARAEVAEAKVAVSDAEKKLAEAVRSIQATCPVEMNPQGLPQCAAPPETTKPHVP